MDWYTDGPAPSREWLFEDLVRYLDTHDLPPETLWPIAFGPSDAIPPQTRQATRSTGWRRLFRRAPTQD
jgi:hypothetical protein